MDNQPRLTPQVARVLDHLMQGDPLPGAELARRTSLKSGTLYPLLLRLEEAGWLTSEWETADPSVLGRPRRRHYSITGVGRAHARSAARNNVSIFSKLVTS